MSNHQTKLIGNQKINYEVKVQTGHPFNEGADHVTATLIIDFNGNKLEQYIYSSCFSNKKGGTLEDNLKFIRSEVKEQWGLTIK